MEREIETETEEEADLQGKGRRQRVKASRGQQDMSPIRGRFLGSLDNRARFTTF